MKKNNRVCAALCAVLPFFGNCVDAEVKSNENLVGINSENNSEDVKTKDIKTEDIKTKDVKKPKKSESSIKKLYEWVMNNKKKSLLFGSVGAHVGWRGLNELRLLAIYKKLDEHYSHGCCSSSVERYTYRFKNKEGEQNLVIKAIPHLSIKWLTFLNEKFACQVIPALAKENEHLAEILDYHYGLGRNYIVYKDVGPNFDWPKKMLDDKWNGKRKFEGLRDVIVQMIDIMLWLCEKGYIHGDIRFDNLSVVNENGKPFVRVFDYGLFRTINDDVPQSSELLYIELLRFSSATLLLSAWWLLGKKLPVYDLTEEDVVRAMDNDAISLLNELKTNYKNNSLIKLLLDSSDKINDPFIFMSVCIASFEEKLNELKTNLQNLNF